eukprot:SAG11_NODE_7372_length_1155_cov_0.917614_1_plen_98_part_00
MCVCVWLLVDSRSARDTTKNTMVVGYYSNSYSPVILNKSGCAIHALHVPYEYDDGTLLMKHEYPRVARMQQLQLPHLLPVLIHLLPGVRAAVDARTA